MMNSLLSLLESFQKRVGCHWNLSISCQTFKEQQAIARGRHIRYNLFYTNNYHFTPLRIWRSIWKLKIYFATRIFQTSYRLL